MRDLAIIIVNYNMCDLLQQCLTSVANSQGDLTFETWVVDNASADASVEMVRRHFPTVKIIASPVNGGFSYANNLGLRAAGFHPVDNEAPRSGQALPRLVGQDTANIERPRHVLLLNADTVLPPTALSDMIAYVDSRPEIGAAGPKLLRADGGLDLACRRSFPTPAVSFYRLVGLSRLFPRSRRFGRYNLTYLDPDEETEVDSVVGAFMLVRRAAIEAVGLLDERFFMYGEDLDWALRIKQAGWKIYYNPTVTVLHYKRASSRGSKRAQFEFYRSMYLFYQKHYAANTPIWIHWLIMAGIASRGGVKLIREMWFSDREPTEVLP